VVGMLRSMVEVGTKNEFFLGGGVIVGLVV